jgi:hypothetical protein
VAGLPHSRVCAPPVIGTLGLSGGRLLVSLRLARVPVAASLSSPIDEVRSGNPPARPPASPQRAWAPHNAPRRQANRGPPFLQVPRRPDFSRTASRFGGAGGSQGHLGRAAQQSEQIRARSIEGFPHIRSVLAVSHGVRSTQKLFCGGMLGGGGLLGTRLAFPHDWPPCFLEAKKFESWKRLAESRRRARESSA